MGLVYRKNIRMGGAYYMLQSYVQILSSVGK